MEGFEKQSDGRLPRPTMSIANPEGLLSKIVRSNKDFANCKVTRKRTFVKFLDKENFQNRNLNESEKNPFGESDPKSHFPDDMFFINKKTVENKNVITFELVSSLELQGATIPGRLVMPTHCSWMYRCSIGCGYKGLAVEDSEGRDLTQKYSSNNYNNGLVDIPKWSKYGFLDNEEVPSGYDAGTLVKIIPQSSSDPYKSTPVVFLCIKTHAIASDHIPFFDVNHWVKDECQKTLDSCKKRFSETHLDSLGGSRNISEYNKISFTHKGLRFGGFPSTERYPIG
jgi:lambda family phage minor tail protein L